MILILGEIQINTRSIQPSIMESDKQHLCGDCCEMNGTTYTAIINFKRHNRICSGCKAERRKTEAPFKCCSDCRMASYCGETCQRKSWLSHKESCERDEAELGKMTPTGRAVLRWIRLKKGAVLAKLSGMQKRTLRQLSFVAFVERTLDNSYSFIKVGSCLTEDEAERLRQRPHFHVVLDGCHLFALVFPMSVPTRAVVENRYQTDSRMVVAWVQEIKNG